MTKDEGDPHFGAVVRWPLLAEKIGSLWRNCWNRGIVMLWICCCMWSAYKMLRKVVYVAVDMRWRMFPVKTMK